MSSKTQKLVEKYNIREINTCLIRLLRVSEDVIKNQKYSLDELTARIGLDKGITKDILNVLVDVGMFEKIDHKYVVPG